jgi:hypothetical protein
MRKLWSLKRPADLPSHESKELHITDAANCLWHVNERSPDIVKNFGNRATRHESEVLLTSFVNMKSTRSFAPALDVLVRDGRNTSFRR